MSSFGIVEFTVYRGVLISGGWNRGVPLYTSYLTPLCPMFEIRSFFAFHVQLCADQVQESSKRKQSFTKTKTKSIDSVSSFSKCRELKRNMTSSDMQVSIFLVNLSKYS